MRHAFYIIITTLLCLWAAIGHAQQVLGGFNLPGKPPASSIGNESQWYLDFASGNIYGPKTLGQWGSPASSSGFAKSGANSDITSLGGLTTPLSLLQGGLGNTNGAVLGVRFPAQNYGPCAASGSLVGQDPGACVMAAYAAAVTAGGGIVTLPAGNFTGQATPIIFSSSYVGLACPSAGIPRDVSGVFRAATTITAGSAMSGLTQFTMAPANGATSYLYGMSLKGCLFNAAGIAANAVVVQNVAYAGEILDIECEEATTTCATLSVVDLASGSGGGQGPGNQHDNITVNFKQLNYNGTGFLTKRANFNGSDIVYNNSYSNIASVSGYYDNGDGLVVSGADNLTIGSIQEFNVGGGAGKACVIAAAGYVTPSGSVTAGSSAAIHINHIGNACLVGGYQTGFAPVAGGTNTCSGCGPATLTLTTNAASPLGSETLYFPSTAGIAADASVSCGDSSSTSRAAVLPGDQVLSVAPTSIVLTQPISTAISSGALCVITSGIRGSAAAGAYIVSYNGSTWDITAPTGGHSQSGITMTGGVALFQDLTWLFTGTANSGDYWTFNADTPTRAIEIDGVDTVVNGVQPGVFQYGAFGWTRETGYFYPTLFGPAGMGTQGVAINGGIATGAGCVSLSSSGGCFSPYSTQAGFSTSAQGYAGSVDGMDQSETGVVGKVGGINGADFNRYDYDARGAPKFSAFGDTQIARTVLSGSATCSGGTVTIRATADKNAAGSTNVLNMVSGQYESLILIANVKDKTAGVARTFSLFGQGVLDNGGTITPDSSSAPSWVVGSYTASAASGWVAPTIAGDNTHVGLNLSWTDTACVGTDTYEIVVGVYSVDH